ncbi:MAG: GyrI-like domain-containing protein, partial [Sphingomonadales bacterium]|nr:GyrI-like domain-containing protein [Sphingomonadales bacterium]
MIEAPYIVDTEAETAAVVHLCVPRTDLPEVVPGAIAELLKEIAAQGLGPPGPMFMHHLTMSPDTFDVEVGFPIAGAITPTGRVKSGTLPAAKVARTIYQ